MLGLREIGHSIHSVCSAWFEHIRNTILNQPCKNTNTNTAINRLQSIDTSTEVAYTPHLLNSPMLCTRPRWDSAQWEYPLPPSDSIDTRYPPEAEGTTTVNLMQPLKWSRLLSSIICRFIRICSFRTVSHHTLHSPIQGLGLGHSPPLLLHRTHRTPGSDSVRLFFAAALCSAPNQLHPHSPAQAHSSPIHLRLHQEGSWSPELDKDKMAYM